MRELIVLGTGNATTIHCYNTCFALKEDDEYFLTDAGGGNGILLALEQNQIRLEQIHHLFVTHAHSDHIFGVFWLLRMIAASMDKGNYQGTLTLYCHAELAQTIQTIAQLTIGKKIARYVDNRILFYIIHDGETRTILNNTFTFFDIRSTKEKQFGFLLHSFEGIRIAFPGDDFSVEGNASTIDLFESINTSKQCGLSTARWTEQDDDLSFLYIEINPPQDFELSIRFM